MPYEDIFCLMISWVLGSFLPIHYVCSTLYGFVTCGKSRDLL